MNSTILSHLFRFIGLVILQSLVLQQMSFGWEDFNYIHVIIYPLFIILLPIRTPHTLQILLGFLIGIAVDLFYGTPGVHASASVFTGFIRPGILKIMEPRGGYNINHIPNMEKFGFWWFFIYAGIMLLLHLFVYFFVNAFTHVYFLEILLRTIFSFLVSLLIILLYVRILNPRE